MAADEEYDMDIATVRAAFVVWRMLVQSWQPTTAEVAQKFGMTRQGAYALLCKISDVVPITQDDSPAHHRFDSPARWRLVESVNVVLTAPCKDVGREV